METILVELVRLGNLALGLLYLLIIFIVGFVIADALGFVAPLPEEEPNKRWLARQQPKPKRNPQEPVRTMRLLYLAFIFTYCVSGVLLGFGLYRFLE